jgi:AraC-like DNA-binding protein
MTAPPLPHASSTTSVPIEFLQQLIQGALDRGYLIERQEGQLKQFQEQGIKRISLDTYIKLFWALRNDTQDELLGLFPRKVPLGTYQALCHALVHMPSIDHCYRYMNRLYSLFNNGTKPWRLIVQDDTVRLEVTPQALDEAALPFYQQSMLLSPYKTLSWLIGANIEPIRVGFTFPELNTANDLSHVFLCPVEFEHPIAFMEMPHKLMERPLVRQEDLIEEFLKHSLDTIILRQNSNPLIDQIKELIAPQVKTGFPTMSKLCEELGMASATFSRRLKGQGTSYGNIKDELRRDLAIYYLSKTTLSAEVVATEVGFSEYSPFHRAFKKWVGVTPKAFRDNTPSI